FDDVSNSLGGHPSAPILPALFALGEVVDCTGRDFITAYVAGFETETRIGRGVHFHHYERVGTRPRPWACLAPRRRHATCSASTEQKPRRRWRSPPRSPPASRPISAR